MHTAQLDSDNCGSIVYKLEELSNYYAIKIFKEIFSHSPIFKEIKEKLNNSDLVNLYFQLIIKYKIYPTLYNIYNSRDSDIEEHKIYPELLSIIHKPVAEKYKTQSLYFWLPETEKNLITKYKGVMKDAFLCLVKYFKKKSVDYSQYSKGMVAIRYYPQLDVEKIKNIFDKDEGGVDASRILVFFPEDNIKFCPTKKLTNLIERLGLKYAYLGTIIFNRKINEWHLRKIVNGNRYKLKLRPSNMVDKWLYTRGNFLIKEVLYWLNFIQKFNIKIMLDVEMRSLVPVFQNIAFEMLGNTGGFLCGYQISILSYPPGTMLGFHPVNILFSWNRNEQKYMVPNFDGIKCNIISGYTYDNFYCGCSDSLRKYIYGFQKKGVKFIISLFDNVHGSLLNPITTVSMLNFYQSFLQWAIEEEDIGIIIKSKGRHVFKKLSNIKRLISFAKETGRFKFIYGKNFSAVEAAKYSDFSVGIGISTAVLEAVLSGRRGIHCDLTKQYSHPYYKWGYKKIIFDNIGELISALKIYKDETNKVSDLGDWSFLVNQIDPFRDGKTWKRINLYISWLIEAFDKGLLRDEALQYANQLYKEKWGEDKVIDMRGEYAAA